jgi:hypothetical protein
MTEPGIRIDRDDIIRCLDILGTDYDFDAPTAELAALMIRVVQDNAKHQDEIIRRAEGRGYMVGWERAMARAGAAAEGAKPQ